MQLLKQLRVNIAPGLDFEAEETSSKRPARSLADSPRLG